MLELYHWEPQVDSGEVLICLREKQLPFRGHYVDLRELQQHQPEFRRLNPRGQVPVLLHDGRVLCEGGLILLYLEEAFPAVPLSPADAAARYAMLAWIKYVEERLAPAISLTGWYASPPPAPAWRDRARASSAALPPERQRWWARLLDEEPPREALALARETLGLGVQRLEQTLERSAWLAGDTYSLADIALCLAVRALAALTPDLLNPDVAAHTLAWLGRLEQRAAVRDTLTMARVPHPERDFMPGPEPVRWG